MDIGIAGKRALVTGSSAGIGEAIARRLAAEGAAVAINGRDRPRAEAVQKSILSAGGHAVLAVGDVENDAGVEAVAGLALAGLGQVDILINNVGGPMDEETGRLAWFDVETKYWMGTYYKCVVAGVRFAQILAPPMRDRGWGRIINFSSVVGSQPTPYVVDYAAAKAAVKNVSVSLAKSLAMSGVTVNTITPGGIMTDAQRRWLLKVGAENGWGEDLDVIEKRRITESPDGPLTQRLGRPEQIADLVAVICGPAGDFVNGANLRVDGGQTKTVN